MAKRAASPAKKPPAAQLDASTRIALITGKDAWLRSGYTDRLRAALTEAHGAIDTFRYDGASASITEPLDECRSFGLLAAHKLVIVDDADDWVKGDERRPIIERYAANPSDAATLVLRSESWHPGKLDKLIADHGAIIKCDSPDRRTAEAILIRKAREELARDLTPDAARMLVDRVGTDSGRLAQEIAKLAAASTHNAQITPALIRELTGVTREEQAWEIQRAVLFGTPEQALAKLRELLEVSRVPTQPLRWSLMDLARKVHGASRGLADRRSPGELSSAFKLWGDIQDGVFTAARKLPPASAARLLNDTLNLDRDSKTGFGDEVRLLEALTLRFTSAIATGSDS